MAVDNLPTIAIFLPALTSESLSMDLPGEIVSKLELIDNDCCFNITNVIPIKIIIPTTRIAVPAIPLVSSSHVSSDHQPITANIKPINKYNIDYDTIMKNQ